MPTAPKPPGRVVALVNGYARRAVIDRRGRFVMTGGRLPHLWELPSGRLRHALPLTGMPSYYADWDIALTPDGKRALASYSDSNLRVWDTASGAEVLRWATRPLTSATGMDATNEWVLIGCRWLKVLQLYELRTGSELLLLKARTSATETVALSEDGRRALSGGGDKRVHLWDLDAGQRLAELSGHTGRVMAVRFAPGGKKAVSASADRTVSVWDLKTGTRLATLTGPTRIMDCLAVSPDGRRVAAGDRDGKVHVWTLADGRGRVLDGHEDTVIAVAFTTDGRAVVSVDQRGLVRTAGLTVQNE
jgi:WD40 repeat protein